MNSQTLCRSDSEDLILITLLVAALEEAGGRCPISTRQLRDHAADRVIPADRINGRWYCRRSDLPRIRQTLGMALRRAAEQ